MFLKGSDINCAQTVTDILEFIRDLKCINKQVKLISTRMGSMCLRIKERIIDDIFTYKQTKIEGQGFMKSHVWLLEKASRFNYMRNL